MVDTKELQDTENELKRGSSLFQKVPNEQQGLSDIANLLRRDVLQMTTAAGSGHPTSCLSCAEIMSALFFNELKLDSKNPTNPDNDEFILSKGHAAPILYASLQRASLIKENLLSLRKINSHLEGHPIPKSLKWIKVATGSLGQGLSAGVGMALAAKLQGRNYRTYVLVGDSEMAEGSNYEALQLAPYYNLDNLCLIVDANRLGQRGETLIDHELQRLAEGISSFKWGAIIVDGHDINQILSALDKARNSGKPTAIIAKTVKGKGISFLENQEGWHGKALNKNELEQALKEIPAAKIPKIKIPIPIKASIANNKNSKLKNSIYEKYSFVSTREAFGKALANLAESNPKVIAVDAEVANSTFTEEVKKVRPGQFVEAFIAEQDMIGICLGLSKKGFDVYGATFAAFLTRAHDQLRMSAISSGNFTICGSHCGVSIGNDGASQMGLEDIALFRTLPESFVFYPSDAVSTEKILYDCSKLKGIKYLRTTRPKTPVIYDNKEKFPFGEFKILKQSKKDKVILVGAGITLHECLKAQESLEKKKISAAVVDLYCIKPFDAKKFISFIKKHGKKLVIAEDHYEEGGIGEMLAEELENSGIKIKHLFVKEVPHSGTGEQLLAKYKIDAKAIAEAAKNIAK
jgi:transketolase